MNKTNILSFGAGVIVGSAFAWVLAKEVYKKVAEEEIASMRESYLEHLNELTVDEEDIETDIQEDEPEETVEFDEKEHEEYERIVKTDYTKFSNRQPAKVIKKNEISTEPENDESAEPDYEVVSYDEIANSDGDLVSLTYYRDGVLCDSNDKPLDDEDKAELIGDIDFVSHFGGKDDPDVVYIRNRKLNTDFEILRDLDNYEEEE